jgi:hypothetical protein
VNLVKKKKWKVNKPNCDIHDNNAAICSSCKHRAYIYPRDKDGLSPENMAVEGAIVACDFCGRQCVSIDKIDPQCMCFRCREQRRHDQELGNQTNLPLQCSCDKLIK